MNRLIYFVPKQFTGIYHLVREAVEAGKIIVHKVDVKDNLANLLTKLVPAHRHKCLRSKIMFLEDKEW